MSADYMDRMITGIRQNLPQVFLHSEVDEVDGELVKLGETSQRLRATAKVSGVVWVVVVLFEPESYLRVFLVSPFKPPRHLYSTPRPHPPRVHPLNHLQSGLEQLFNQLTRPRLRAILDECYKDVAYLLDEESFAEADEVDIVRKRFARAWEGLVGGYKVSWPWSYCVAAREREVARGRERERKKNTTSPDSIVYLPHRLPLRTTITSSFTILLLIR